MNFGFNYDIFLSVLDRRPLHVRDFISGFFTIAGMIFDGWKIG
jgi:hypothetical protein